RHRHQGIARQYPIIGGRVGLMWAAAVLGPGPTLPALAAAVLGTILLGIAITDARHYLIPDEFTWGGLVLGLAISLGGGVPGFLQAVLGAGAGLALIYGVEVIGERVFQDEARGGGDV